MWRLFRGLAAGVWLWGAAWHAPLAYAIDTQLQLKAVYLGRFASYVQWPRQEASAFDITVLGAHPLGEQLAALYADKRIQGKPVHIRTVARIEDIGTPEVLFVALPTLAARQAAITYAQRHGILTIGDTKGFA